MSDGDLILWGIVAFIIIVPIVFLCVHLSEKSSERAEVPELRSRLDAFAQRISSLTKQYLGHSTGDFEQDLQALYKDAEQKYRKLLASKGIKKEDYTWSNIGTCGISSTHFWYNLMESNCKYTSRHISSRLLFSRSDDINKYREIISDINRGPVLARIYIPELEEKAIFLEKIENGTFVPYWNSILLNDIQCYRIDGEVHHVSNTYGSGASVGGTGAVGIRTDIETIDNRKITLFYQKNGEMNTLEIQLKNPGHTEFDEMLKAVRNLIPGKEEGVASLQVKQTAQLPKADKNLRLNAGETTIPEQIKQYKDLLDIGAITQEEFNAKKKQLLGL